MAFDRIVVVDWSANARPKRGADSIWSCALRAGDGTFEVHNHPTRRIAADRVRDLLVGATGERVLVGCDFPYGFPAGTAAAAGLAAPGEPAWTATWRHLVAELVDEPNNRNNRFAVAAAVNARISDGVGPFWGAPPARVTESLAATKAPGFPHVHRTGTLPEHRLAEVAVRERTGRRPFPIWQLLGAGSVGSQALTGIPVVAGWRHDPALAERSLVWPFETGLALPDVHPTTGATDLIVHAEIWPSSIDVDLTVHEVKDAAQVICLARHLAALDHRGVLAAEFAPPLGPDDARAVVSEEGWIVGATLWP